MESKERAEFQAPSRTVSLAILVDAPAKFARRAVPLVRELSAAAKRDRAFVLISSSFLLVSAMVGPFLDWPGAVGSQIWFGQVAIDSIAAFCGMMIYERIRRHRHLPAIQGYTAAWIRLRESTLTNARLAAFSIICGLLPIVLACFTGWKVWLNRTIPFAWDTSLSAIDYSIHGERYPWEWLQPIYEHRWLTTVIVGVYTFGWILALQGATVWQALARPSRQRSQFLVACALAWPLAGNILAGAYMSGGPWFDARMDTYGSQYAQLANQIVSIGGRSLWAQDYLFSAYAARHNWEVASGISAMPSMHVVMATILAALVFRHGWLARMAAVFFVLTILIGSVLLGWHYAIDGYVGVVIGLSVWWIAGRIAGRREAKPSTR